MFRYKSNRNHWTVPVLILEQIGLYFFSKVLNSCYVWPNPDLCNANIICMYTLYNKSDFRAVEKLEFLDYIYIYQYTYSKFNHILFIVLQSFYKMITKNKPRQKEDFSNPDEDVDENREELIAENALLMERYVRTL